MSQYRGTTPLMVAKKDDRTNCPVCGMEVMIVRDVHGNARRYRALIAGEAIQGSLKPQDPEVAERLREQRKGKKTVALVGLSPSSCSKAPWDDMDVEIWGLNEAHAFTWMKRATRWIQIHCNKSWKRPIAKRDVRGHYDWLRKNPWNIPIYMQHWNEEIPNVVEYPLHAIYKMFLGNFWRGDKHVKYFTSTLAYMIALALYEGRHGVLNEKPFDRIELYGFDLSDDVEYVKQKACAEFWIGMAMGMGVEVWSPENCQILWSALYGGHELGDGWQADEE
jgi:hypothetical protein